jgi:hypothetical protein
MRRCTDLLELDPLSPIGISPIADISPTTDPLALEPLSPLPDSWPPGPTPVGRTGDATGDPSGRDAPHAPAALPS